MFRIKYQQSRRAKLPFMSSPNQFQVHNPATGEILARLPIQGAAATVQAIESAAQYVPAPLETRQKWLETIGAALLAQKAELAQIITEENGKPLIESKAEVEYAAGFFRFFAENIGVLEPQILPKTARDCTWTIFHRPAGVVGLITPWNFPLAMLAKKLPAALAAGCAAVVKPAEQTPISALALHQIAREAGVPESAFGLVCGDASAIGKALCEHPDVRMISFTGSTQIGKILAAQAAPFLKKLSLELGGNAPFIVLESADLERAADALMASKFRCAGQTCVCANRILVQKSIVEKFTDLVIERVQNLREIGPLIDKKGWQKVASHVEDALQNGAQKVWGEKPITPKNDWGYFFPPTVLGDCRDEMRVFREETFGPVVAISNFEDEMEAITRANATPFGLAAYIFGDDQAQLNRAQAELKFGYIGRNSGTGPAPHAPFGGFKMSGFGREGGIEGLLEWCESQTVAKAF